MRIHETRWEPTKSVRETLKPQVWSRVFLCAAAPSAVDRAANESMWHSRKSHGLYHKEHNSIGVEGTSQDRAGSAPKDIAGQTHHAPQRKPASPGRQSSVRAGGGGARLGPTQRISAALNAARCADEATYCPEILTTQASLHTINAVRARPLRPCIHARSTLASCLAATLHLHAPRVATLSAARAASRVKGSS